MIRHMRHGSPPRLMALQSILRPNRRESLPAPSAGNRMSQPSRGLVLRDLPEMFAVRGIVFSYEAVREWEAKLTPALAEALRRRRRGQVGRSWYVDEIYLKVQGHWCYLYRAIDRNGTLVDVLFSEHRDMAAAQAFFRS